LWFADARQFVLTKKSITDAVYIHQKYGPVPKYGKLARDQLEKEGAIRISREDQLKCFLGRVQAIKLISLTNAWFAARLGAGNFSGGRAVSRGGLPCGWEFQPPGKPLGRLTLTPSGWSRLPGRRLMAHEN
jgi:hypothetical protein